MFRELLILDHREHADLRLRRLPHYQHAAGEQVVPVIAAECWQIAREYVMLFPGQQDALPVALLGTEPGVNAHVGEDPPWWGRYVPAHIRRYPFILAPVAGDPAGSQHVLCIDAAAAHLDRQQGEPLFDSAGQPTPLLDGISRMLLLMQREQQRTQSLVRQIAAAGLLRQRELRLGTAALSGFAVVDSQCLQQLTPQALATLQRSGALALIYAHLGSLSNLQDGWLAQCRQAARDAGTPASGDPWAGVAALFEDDQQDNINFG